MDLKLMQERIQHAIKPMESESLDEYFWGMRSKAGRSLPPYYLVYFLLVDLLKFNNRGLEEKVAFSIPVKINGTILIVEHRKLGLGVFIKCAEDEDKAKAVVRCINAGVKAGKNYFDALADNAAKGSNLNVNNNSNVLFERFCYFSNSYNNKCKEVEANQKLQVKKKPTVNCEDFDDFPDQLQTIFDISNKTNELRREAMWCAMAAIEAFFSWTEHVFILIAILQGKIKTGKDVADKVGDEWGTKFKLAINIDSSDTKKFYDSLLALRKQIRNFVSHGSFGKDGQALEFHSTVGAVPLLMPHRQSKEHFKFGNGITFLAPEAMRLLTDFIDNMWSGSLSLAKIYIESGMPLILSYVINGTYAEAMSSEDDMVSFVDYLSRSFDDAANMDW